ncbi:Dephospho-CoA kinase [Pseudovibrio axinellae]|uniref:Dephospho-CoA kinase n=1 Tax=Pseudovibrio axinellae TaxID=989403 RepID=A0A165ZMZ9_9HYPH|nr:dephospho-CoA kinase [Pseudovibrio axinellae]KZL20075.1 Dephospho-CoA kinase [Pseudovibrio axinellae]SEQ26473.1 dephospho-CoA kinase [Pseudovibrio axinellae]
MVILGLTGSIGMGKSTTSRLFAEAGAAVYDSDAAVHDLYSGKAVTPVGDAFPGVVKENQIDREALGKIVLQDKAKMLLLESLIHPLVQGMEMEFLKQAKQDRRKVVVLDVPLLFEVGKDKAVDAVVVVSAPYDVQRRRVLERPGMTEDKFEAIYAKQLNDAEKRKRAHFIVDTSRSWESARRSVSAIMRAVSSIASRTV